jgi:hypothetical protein
MSETEKRVAQAVKAAAEIKALGEWAGVATEFMVAVRQAEAAATQR